jgi:RHS repeat-associated protein
MADTIRPPAVRGAAAAPPIAGGLLQETTYLHSGELETGAVDLDAGGRAGWNVVVDRTYRSSTIGLSPLGAGWDASMFRRLRVLPNGNVEYRDGTGEIWLFAKANGSYAAPAGLFLRLSRMATGWLLTDQKSRFTTFDDLGRLASESDEFFDPRKPHSGNTIHYLYGSDGRLSKIIDPVGRTTNVTIDRTAGLLREIVDWRSRKIEYAYDAQRLSEVRLPEVGNTSGERPRIAYGYDTAGGSLNEQLELAPNLVTIRDPKEVISNGAARVTFRYVNDRVDEQIWATGEKARITYDSPAQVTVIDALGQERRYTLTSNSTTDLLADRAHVSAVREVGVPVWSGAAFGQLATTVAPGAPDVTPADRVQTFTFDGGVTRSAKLDGVRETTLGYEPAKGAPGLVMSTTTSTPIQATPITRTFTYQSGSFLDSVIANGRSVEIKEPHRANPAPTSTNDAIAATTRFDTNGLLTESMSTGGTDTASVGAQSRILYYSASDPIHTRGRPNELVEGDDLRTTITYPSATQTRSEDARQVVTATTVDAWDRPIEITVEKPGDLALRQTFAYDATGRLERTTEKKGSEEVATSFAYDVMGRRTSTTTNHIASVGSVTTTTTYDLAARRIVTRHPGGATTTTELDPLGRTTRTVTDTGSSPIEQRFAYDLDGNRVFASDMYTVATSAFDGHGRAVATRAANGVVATAQYDEWDHPTVVKHLDRNATEVVAQSSYAITPAGRMESMKTAIDAVRTRDTKVAWDGGGRTTRTATNGRASETKFSSAGLLLHQARGSGDLSALQEVFTTSALTEHDGELPARTEETEKGATYVELTKHNTAGDVTSEKVGALEWKTGYDELGNVVEASVPGRPPTSWKVDARGLIETEKLPDGAANHFAYDGAGAQINYQDPTNEETITQRDLIGRPLKRTYRDQTTEVIEWEGPRVKAVTDRQQRKQVYVYDGAGEVTEIQDGSGQATDVLEYDEAGRLISWKTADAELTWGEFDLDGNPRRTSQKRFRDASGLSVNAAVALDEVVQQHRWNEHGERTRFSMPIADGAIAGARWTKWLEQRYDAMGNVTAISRVDDDLATATAPLMTASYRAAGRPDVRTVFTAGGPIVRQYEYHPQTSLLNAMEVTAKGVTVAGTAVQHEGLQTSEARLLGVASGERASKFAYDDRSRLRASVFGARRDADPQLAKGSAREDVDPADFRKAHERTRALKTLAAVDPPSSTYDEKPGGGHKIDKITKGPVVRPFGYDGAERVDDGRFVYTFDARGRLIRATEKSTLPPIRRKSYSYTGTGRLIGRRAEYANVASPKESDWKLEDRASILSSDGLPAETTFAWDPITDRLLAVYRAGATSAPVKQIIHGQSAYDDPLETATADARLYPIYDEAATRALQAVVNANAEVVARNLTNDPFGAEDVALTGPAIDGVAITGRKTGVDVSMHATEQLSVASLATGIRIAALDAAGAVVRVAPVPPTLTPDAYTTRVSFTASEWTSLTAAPAATLSIAATSTLRASSWGEDVLVMPAPDWAVASQPVFASPDLPFEVRESLSSLATYLAGIPAGEERTTQLFEVATLPLLGVPPGGTPLTAILSSAFQALPFAEASTGLVYARARWVDPSSGTFLSPDPLGYRDSSNLYAFCAGDPVNCSDPDGRRAMTAEDKRNLAILKGRGKKLYDDFTATGRGSFRLPMRVPVVRKWYDTSGVPGGNYETQMVDATVTTRSSYELAKRTMVNDVATFQSAVARADADGEILYVSGHGFTTITAADRKRADRTTMIAAGIFFATDTLPMMVSPVAMRQPLRLAELPQPVSGENRYTRAGRLAHEEEPLPPGYVRKVRLPSGKEMDAYNPRIKDVIEIKPNNPRQIKRGEKQVRDYCVECNEVYGPGHTGRVQTYEPAPYVKRIDDQQP